MALDVIKEVGPRGQFLRQRHTRDNMRLREYSDLTGQTAPGGDFRDPLEVAREKVDWILKNHSPEPLVETEKRELKQILIAADKELR
jgi:trimethylamine--corrinoid protein Co-methyltransferase